MWSKLDDALIDHVKVFEAGALLGGKNGPAAALGFFTVLLMWTNKHLTDGFVPEAVLRTFRHVDQPLVVAGALTKAGLLERADKGFLIHDFHDFNPLARDIRRRRKADRLRKQSERNGHADA
jgi:hypothetical protein